MNEPFTYDVFISYSSKDKNPVRNLAQRLKSDGLRVWFDEWEIGPGDVIGLKIEQGLERSRTLILVMSTNAFASDWVKLERFTALFRDPSNVKRRFIPLRLDDAEIKDTMKQFAYVDWRERKETEYANLISACRPLVATPEISTEMARETTTKKKDTTPSQVLRGHTDDVMGLALTPDGRRVVSCSDDEAVRVWDLETGKCLTVFKEHTSGVKDVAVTPDGRRVVSCSEDNIIRVWDLETGTCITVLEGHTNIIWRLAVTPDSRRLASCSEDNTIRVWNLETGTCITILEGHTRGVNDVAVTPDGRRVVSCSDDGLIRVWDLETGTCKTVLEGHTNIIWGIAVTPDGRRLASCSNDNTIRVWNLETGTCITILEGHTSSVYDVAVTPDGRRIVSGSEDETVRVWDLETGTCITILEGHTESIWGLAVTPDGRRVVSGSEDKTIRVWDLPSFKAPAEVTEATRYTNAKVLLVGDSGVGKSGLAMRLTQDCFEPTISTDAAWATQIKLPFTATGDIEREIWLWDFGGQADYRLIHQLFMDETALAVLVFNPQSDNPFEGLGQWDRDLQRAARRSFQKLLVAGRCDRGGMIVSNESIERFRDERGFADFLETSAQTGVGCSELYEAIVQNIPWEQIPWTSSPITFRHLKQAILGLKDQGKVLLRMAELRQQIEMTAPGFSFLPEELRAVVGLLVGPGAVWQLEFGDFVLLQPERVNSYAAAVIRSVRAHKEEIGCIREERVLAGDLDYQDMERLPDAEEQIVLRAMHQTLVDHGLCLREHTEAGTLLVFPSYFKRERPEQSYHPSVFITYRFSGPLDEIYATLIVRLFHTAAFEKDELWQYAADFKTHEDKRLGLKMTKKAEGNAEITVYFDPDIPDDTKVTFIKYIHEHLQVKDPKVERLRQYICGHCNRRVMDFEAIQDRLSEGKKDIICVRCEKRVPLLDLIEKKFASEKFKRRVHELEKQARASIDNESQELILVGHAFAIAGEAGQIFRPTPNSDWGIDGEIEFKDYSGKASGKRVYLQLKSGDSYLYKRRKDGVEVFNIKKPRHADYWQQQAYPVMLVIRTSDRDIRWMDVSAYLKEKSKGRKTPVKQIVFEGEAFTSISLQRLRDKLIPPPQ